MIILASILKGVALGLGAAVPLGPVNVEIARRTLTRGWFAGMALGCGAVTADIIYATLTSLGVRPFLDSPAALRSLGIIAAVVLAYMAFGCIKNAFRARDDGAAASNEGGPGPSNSSSTRGNYLAGLAMTLLNPFNLLFWFVAVPGSVGQITSDPMRDLPIVCIGVFLGATAWNLFFTTLISVLGRFSRRSWLRAANLVGGVVLLWFAGRTVINVIRMSGGAAECPPTIPTREAA